MMPKSGGATRHTHKQHIRHRHTRVSCRQHGSMGGWGQQCKGEDTGGVLDSEGWCTGVSPAMRPTYKPIRTVKNIMSSPLLLQR